MESTSHARCGGANSSRAAKKRKYAEGGRVLRTCGQEVSSDHPRAARKKGSIQRRSPEVATGTNDGDLWRRRQGPARERGHVGVVLWWHGAAIGAGVGTQRRCCAGGGGVVCSRKMRGTELCLCDGK